MKILLETERLILRHFIPDDAKHIFKLHNDIEVMRYIPHKEPLNVPIEKCEKFINLCTEQYGRKPGYGLFAAIKKDTGEFIGWNEINSLDCTDDIEIGYRYFEKYWGKGYATEISLALVEYGFSKLNLDKLVGIAMPQNKASIRVLEKIGMKYVGMRRYYGGDFAYYQLLKADT
ncbi:MAG: GNAT family N-acetyltransferase [Eubacteriales bacterium]